MSKVTNPNLTNFYELVNVSPNTAYAFNGVKVNPQTITLDRANELYAQGFPHLKKVEKKEEEKPKDKDKKK